MANSDRLTETSWRKSPLGTISRLAAITRLGWLVKVASTMPARGAISQIARNTSTARVETTTRYFDEVIGIVHLPSSEDISKLDEPWGNSRELRGLREWAHQKIPWCAHSRNPRNSRLSPHDSSISKSPLLSARLLNSSHEARPDMPPILDKELGIHRLDGARTGQVHGDDFGDAAGIPGHHHDLICEKNRFVDAVGNKQGRFLFCSQMASSSLPISSRVWASSEPKGSSNNRISGSTARARAMPTAAACRRRAGADGNARIP